MVAAHRAACLPAAAEAMNMSSLPCGSFTPEELKARRLASLQVSLYQLELAKATLEQWRPTVSGGREKEQVERAERLGPRMLKMVRSRRMPAMSPETCSKGVGRTHVISCGVRVAVGRRTRSMTSRSASP